MTKRTSAILNFVGGAVYAVPMVFCCASSMGDGGNMGPFFLATSPVCLAVVPLGFLTKMFYLDLSDWMAPVLLIGLLLCAPLMWGAIFMLAGQAQEKRPRVWFLSLIFTHYAVTALLGVVSFIMGGSVIMIFALLGVALYFIGQYVIWARYFGVTQTAPPCSDNITPS